jgi:chromate transporter
MNDGEAKLWFLAFNLALLSFVAIGGIAPILPEIHRQVVDVHGWLSADQFTNLFAIAQASPGPNYLVVSLIGLEIAGLRGAVIATIAITAPTCILAYSVGIVWKRFRQARWRIAVQAGLIPVTIGLVSASAYVIAQGTVTSYASVGVLAVTAVGLTFTNLHPILFLAAGAALGFAGLL